MSKYTLNSKITFFASLGYVNANSEEVNTLKELGFTSEELEQKSDEEIDREIQSYFEEWLYNHDVGWHSE